jgi:Flagellar biosynthesis protein, FliO
MSAHSGHQLRIVEISQPIIRRPSGKAAAGAQKSKPTKLRATVQAKPGKKRNIGKKVSASRTAKALVHPATEKNLAPKPARRRWARPELVAAPISEPVSPTPVEIPLGAPEQPVFLGLYPEEIAAEAENCAVENMELAPEVTPIVNIPLEQELPVEAESVAPPEGDAEFPVIPETPLNATLEPGLPAEASSEIVLSAESENLRRAAMSPWNGFLQVLTGAWNWLWRRLKTQQAKKRLRVCETVSLGEKRFIAVVQVDGEQFLVGGSSSSVSTLAHLERPSEFSTMFKRLSESGTRA